jgi:hypothetical protein
MNTIIRLHIATTGDTSIRMIGTITVVETANATGVATMSAAVATGKIANMRRIRSHSGGKMLAGGTILSENTEESARAP